MSYFFNSLYNVSFSQLLQHVAEKEAEEKFQLVHNCKMFIGWPTLSLKRVSSLLKWLEVDAGEGKAS